MDRHPPRISVVLSVFGGASIISSILFFGGSFYVENDIGRAFCFGAFFSGLLGAILLFGFAKVIDMLDAIRQQRLADGPPEVDRAHEGERRSRDLPASQAR